MYQTLDVVSLAEKRGELIALEDRLRYRAFFETAEAYAEQHGLRVGGRSAIRFLLADPASPPLLGLDSFQYELYTERPRRHAWALADAFYRADPDGLGHYTSVMTKEEDRRLIISADGRDLVTVITHPRDSGDAVARPGQFAPIDLPCLPPELVLIEVLGLLCSPANAGDWPDLLAAEASLRGLATWTGGDEQFLSSSDADTSDSESGITGGRARGKDRGKKEKNTPNLLEYLLKHLGGDDDRVVIGDVAIAIMQGHPPSGRLQFVTAHPLEAEARLAAKLAAQKSIPLQWKISPADVPGESRMKVLTLVDPKKKAVADFFNAASFEPTPYIPGPVHIGTPFVLMRFRLIDRWALDRGTRAGRIPNAGAANHAAAGYRAAAVLLEHELSSGRYDRVLPLEAYAGKYEPRDLAIRRAAEKRFFPPYFPASRLRGTQGNVVAVLGNDSPEEVETLPFVRESGAGVIGTEANAPN